MARRTVAKTGDLEHAKPKSGTLDVTLYRDDYRIAFKQPSARVTDIPFDMNGRRIVLVDDVLFAGRTIRAALDALMDLGRPKPIQLAVLVGRQNYELPIRADCVGLQLKTQPNQEVRLRVKEVDGEESLWLVNIDRAVAHGTFHPASAWARRRFPRRHNAYARHGRSLAGCAAAGGEGRSHSARLAMVNLSS